MANENARGPESSRRAVLIVVILAITGLLIAVGGATAIVLSRRSAPNEAFEVIVSRRVPLVAGDSVTYRVGNRACANLAVLGTHADGRVTIPACEGASGPPVAVDRSTLRLNRFPVQGSLVEPAPGDVVLVVRDDGYARAEIVAVTPRGDLRVRSRSAGEETVVPRGAVYLVQRPGRFPATR